MGVVGDTKFIARLRRAAKVGPAVDRWANESAEIIAQEARDLLDEGAVSGSQHKPSVAPLPPNTDTGNLKAHTNAEDLPEIGHAAAISDAEYSLSQEYGYAPNNLPERPFMRVATANKRKLLLQNARTAINKTTR